MNEFSKISGLKVNLNKSELGHSKVEIYTHNFLPGIKITTDKFKLLGIIIPTNAKQKDLIEENYYNKKKKILEIIKSWQKRDLTLYGKLAIIKSLIIPQLTYALTILPSPGELFLNDIEKIILIFFWDDKPAKIKKTILFKEKTEGGLYMTNIKIYAKSVKFQWIYKLIMKITFWKHLICARCSRLQDKIIWESNLKMLISWLSNQNFARIYSCGTHL